MCGIFRRRRRVSRESGIAIMQQRVDRLDHMVKYSMETSDMLRKRLAEIGSYYDGVLQRLQDKMRQLRIENENLSTNIANQAFTVDYEKPAAMLQLQSMLEQKEMEILKLKEMLYIHERPSGHNL